MASAHRAPADAVRAFVMEMAIKKLCAIYRNLFMLCICVHHKCELCARYTSDYAQSRWLCSEFVFGKLIDLIYRLPWKIMHNLLGERFPLLDACFWRQLFSIVSRTSHNISMPITRNKLSHCRSAIIISRRTPTNIDGHMSDCTRRYAGAGCQPKHNQSGDMGMHNSRKLSTVR